MTTMTLATYFSSLDLSKKGVVVIENRSGALARAMENKKSKDIRWRRKFCTEFAGREEKSLVDLTTLS